jgi:hypothetical protein
MSQAKDERASRLEEVFQEEMVRLGARNCVAALDRVLKGNPAWEGWIVGLTIFGSGALPGVDMFLTIRDDYEGDSNLSGAHADVRVESGSPPLEIRRDIQAAIDEATAAALEKGLAEMDRDSEEGEAR